MPTMDISDSLLSQYQLERALEYLARSRVEAEDLWKRYVATKEFLKKNLYPWVQANCNWYTDHGEEHVEAVIEAAGSLLAPNLSPERLGTIDCMALFCLLTGIIWHDVGMVSERSGHEKRIAQFSDSVKQIAFPNASIQSLVSQIATAHTGKDALRQVKPEADCTGTHHTHTIYPRALAAILRFADELSDDQRRVSSPLMDTGTVPPQNRVFWEYARCVTAVRPDPIRGRVVVTLEIQRELASRRFPCAEYPTRCTDGEITCFR